MPALTYGPEAKTVVEKKEVKENKKAAQKSFNENG